ncbi:ABC transporter [Streptomyces sp. NPDC052309]|uniref:ABC transporter n=1 Tax=Streptomyces sp. NPDC052309 TaxID=3155421 RepID=UPI003417BB33
MRGVTWALAGPVRRTLPWRALGAAGAVGLLIAGVPRVTGAQPNPWQTLVLLRGIALVGALGLAFLLDDPARHLTAAVPTRRPVRQALRAALVAPLVALWWTAVLLLAPPASRPPAGDITLEAAVTCVFALAGAAVAVRLTDEPRPGPGVAAALLVSAALAPLLAPESWALFVPSADERWAAAHDRWAVLLVVAVVGWGVCGPEPVARRRRRATAARAAGGAG